MRPTLSKLPALMTAMTLLLSICASGCGGTRTIQLRDGQISQAAETKTLNVYVKDASGKTIKAAGTIHEGDYIVPDKGIPDSVKKSLNAPQGPKPAPAPAPATGQPVTDAPLGEVILLKS